jgi:hypothetical protein
MLRNGFRNQLAKRPAVGEGTLVIWSVCTVAPRRGMLFLLQYDAASVKEIHMYIGGGILGTILVIALIVFLLRRA